MGGWGQIATARKTAPAALPALAKSDQVCSRKGDPPKPAEQDAPGLLTDGAIHDQSVFAR
jgi:hypothetical protein